MTFSEDMNGFESGDLTASAGTLGAVSLFDPSVYAAIVTAPSSGVGVINLNVAANVATAATPQTRA